jgi:hypothetical protein
MDLFNKIVTAIFNVLFLPLQALSFQWGLLIISILTGLFMLLMFKRVSNQHAILLAKNSIKAHLLGIRLYKHDAALSLIETGQLFAGNARYFYHIIKPLLILSVPVMIVLIQVGSRFGFQPAQVNKPIIVTVRVGENVDVTQVSLKPSPGIKIETPPLRLPGHNEINWRVRPVENGRHLLIFNYGEKSVSKNLVADHRHHLLAAKRVRANTLAALLYPAESALNPDCFIREIIVNYKENAVIVAGLSMHWLVSFVVVSVAIGLMAKGIFKIQI